MPKLELPDITLHYEDQGQGHPVILIAGMLSDSASWGPLVDPLAKCYRVIRPDNRTTGRTTPTLASTSPQQNAKDILALMDHLELSQAHIIGHSMGGYIAAEFAAMSPQRISSLTLLCSAPMNIARSWHLFQNLCDIRRNAPAELWLNCLFPWLFHHKFFDHPDHVEGAIAASLAYPYAQSLDAMQHQLDALKRYYPTHLVDRVNTPTLALLAQNDLIVPQSEAHGLLSQIPDALIKVIPDAGHSIHWDAPEDVLAHLVPFLERHRNVA